MNSNEGILTQYAGLLYISSRFGTVCIDTNHNADWKNQLAWLNKLVAVMHRKVCWSSPNFFICSVWQTAFIKKFNTPIVEYGVQLLLMVTITTMNVPPLLRYNLPNLLVLGAGVRPVKSFRLNSTFC